MVKKKANKLEILPLYLWQLKIFIPILLITVLLLTLLIYNNFTINQVQKLAELENMEVGLKETLTKNYAQVKNVPAYKAKLLELRDLESQINSRFPSSDEISALLIQINQVAEDSDVTITNFIPKETKEVNLIGNVSGKNKIMSETFTIIANSRYLNFLDFVVRIARLSRVIDFQTITISRMDNDSISTNFDIKIYFSSK